jgi:hypothetical protein
MEADVNDRCPLNDIQAIVLLQNERSEYLDWALHVRQYYPWQIWEQSVSCTGRCWHLDRFIRQCSSSFTLLSDRNQSLRNVQAFGEHMKCKDSISWDENLSTRTSSSDHLARSP